jgi:hypothetical protein
LNILILGVEGFMAEAFAGTRYTARAHYSHCAILDTAAFCPKLTW